MAGDFKSNDFASREAYEMARKLQEACPSGSRRFTQIFDDFCAIAAISLRQGVLRCFGKADPELEAEYERRVEPYGERKTIFPEAFALLVLGMEGTMDMRARKVESFGNKPLTGDFLGSVYEAAGCSNAASGQFFTPWAISSMVARMTLGDRKPTPGHRYTLHEPAVGAGAMVLAANEVFRENGWLPHHWWFSAQDIDDRCFHMTYIQLSLTGCPGVVLLGNSLSAEPPTRAWVTPTGAMFPFRRRKEDATAVSPPMPEKTDEEHLAATRELIQMATSVPEQAPAEAPGATQPAKARKPRREPQAASSPVHAADADTQLSLF